MNSDIKVKKDADVSCRRLLAVMVCFVVTSAFAPPRAEEESEEEKAFLSDLQKTQELIEKQRWKRASKSLETLLEEHAEEYVFAKRMDIEGYIATLAFWDQYEIPKDDDLVSGKLLFYRESSGVIKLLYHPDNLGDFMKGGNDDETVVRTGAFIHPALFSGPYTIEVRGQSHSSIHSSHIPIFIACLDEEGFYQGITGKKGEAWRRVPPRIYRCTEQGRTTVGKEASSPTALCKPFSLKLKVSATTIAAYYQSKLVVRGKKPKDLYGRAGFVSIPFDEILITGEVQPSWIQGLRDLHKQKARLAFEKSYKPEEHVPEWLSRDADIVVAEVQSRFNEIPGAYIAEQEKYLEKAQSFYDEGKFKEGLDYVGKVPAGNLSNTGRAFMTALFHQALGEFEMGLEQCEIACKGDPRSYPTKFLRAGLGLAVGEREQGLNELRELIESHPENPQAYALLSLQHMFKGNLRETERILKDAQVRKLASADLDRASRALFKAKNGPGWSNKMHEVESAHYHIITDIDKNLCREVARLLEESYTSYVVHLERIRDIGNHKFPVYLFSGQAGYMMYMKDLCVYDNGLSLGCFVPALKQLMIWNTPDRDQMLRTVRHEGFHQYLDCISEDPPIWFNEGMAKYYTMKPQFLRKVKRKFCTRFIKALTVEVKKTLSDLFLRLKAEG